MGAWIETKPHLVISPDNLTVAPLVGAWIETRSYKIVEKRLIGVAPLVGAWIETCVFEPKRCIGLSLPSWERGLKLFIYITIFIIIFVAPLVGAWIETISGYYRLMLDGVAPLVGAWIETIENANKKHKSEGRSPRGSVD